MEEGTTVFLRCQLEDVLHFGKNGLKSFVQKVSKGLTLFPLERPFSLIYLMFWIKKFIHDFELYDKGYPSMVVCNHELEKVLGKKIFHIEELQKLLFKLVVNREGKSLGRKELEVVILELPPEEMETTWNLLKGISWGKNSRLKSFKENPFLKVFVKRAFRQAILKNDPRDVFSFKRIVDATKREVLASSIGSGEGYLELDKNSAISKALRGTQYVSIEHIEDLVYHEISIIRRSGRGGTDELLLQEQSDLMPDFL